MTKLLLALIVSFILSATLMPFIIKFLRRKSANQTILGYVEEHKSKNGTTTMGGVVFIISTLVLAFMFLKFDTLWFMCLIISVFFGILGLMDDHLKIKYKQNLGLRPYQKIIGQVGISLIFAIFIYFNFDRSGEIFLPFMDKTINLGFWIIPFVMLVLIATTNSVNLTDGLDGLAGSVTFVYLIFFTFISIILKNNMYLSGETGKIIENFENINILSMLFAGSILGFLLYNTNKASIFMGDVGSLCIGGYVGASACCLGLEFMIVILGFCFVFSAISVILQVASFKIRRKRIFKMAPFHHHLQMMGLSESKVVAIYSTITLILGSISIIFYLL